MVPPLVVCRKCKKHECLVETLETHTDVPLLMVKCQKICHGPVVGLQIAGRMEWFERLESRKAIAALISIAEERHPDSIPKSLKKRRVKRRSGRRPRD